MTEYPKSTAFSLLERGAGQISSRVALLTLVLSIQSGIASALTNGATPQVSSPSLVESSDATRIEVLKRSFSAYETQILAGIDQYVKDPGMREKIRNTFNAFHNGDITFVFDQSYIQFAGYNGRSRRITLQTQFDPQDPGWLVSLAHEYRHSIQYDECLRTVPKERYIEFWTIPADTSARKILVIPEYEADAIAQEMEMMNITMKGKLRESAIKGESIPIPTRNNSQDRYFKIFSREYFRNPQGFTNFVRRSYLTTPDVLMFNPDLTPIPEQK